MIMNLRLSNKMSVSVTSLLSTCTEWDQHKKQKQSEFPSIYICFNFRFEPHIYLFAFQVCHKAPWWSEGQGSNHEPQHLKCRSSPVLGIKKLCYRETIADVLNVNIFNNKITYAID